MKKYLISFTILIFLTHSFPVVYANDSVNNYRGNSYCENNNDNIFLKINQKTDSIQIIYNPERDHIKITLDLNCLSENNEWFFIQPSGEVYKQGKINSLSTGMYQITINTKKLQSGEYTFVIKDNDLVISKKIAIDK